MSSTQSLCSMRVPLFNWEMEKMLVEGTGPPSFRRFTGLGDQVSLKPHCSGCFGMTLRKEFSM